MAQSILLYEVDFQKVLVLSSFSGMGFKFTHNNSFVQNPVGVIVQSEMQFGIWLLHKLEKELIEWIEEHVVKGGNVRQRLHISLVLIVNVVPFRQVAYPCLFIHLKVGINYSIK